MFAVYYVSFTTFSYLLSYSTVPPHPFFSNLEFNFGFVIPLSILVYRDQDVQQTVFISLWRKEMCEDS